MRKSQLPEIGSAPEKDRDKWILRSKEHEPRPPNFCVHSTTGVVLPVAIVIQSCFRPQMAENLRGAYAFTCVIPILGSFLLLYQLARLFEVASLMIESFFLTFLAVL